MDGPFVEPQNPLVGTLYLRPALIILEVEIVQVEVSMGITWPNMAQSPLTNEARIFFNGTWHACQDIKCMPRSDPQK